MIVSLTKLRRGKKDNLINTINKQVVIQYN